MDMDISVGPKDDIDRLEALATYLASAIGIALCAAAINKERFVAPYVEGTRRPLLFEVLQDLAMGSSLLTMDAPDRASHVMRTARGLASTVGRWRVSAPFDVVVLRALFERAQQLGGHIQQASSWEEVTEQIEVHLGRRQPATSASRV